MKYYLSFDVGGTQIKFALLTELGEIIEQGKMDTAKRGEQIIRDIVAVKNRLSERHTIQGVAFSIPGFVNVETGFLPNSGAIHDFLGLNFKHVMTEKLGLPVELDNDGNCVALAERWLGKGKESDNFICMTIGTGIGGAICLNGDIVRGHSYMGGEFGFMLLNNLFKATEKSQCSMNYNASIREGLIHNYGDQQTEIVDGLSGVDIYALADQGDAIALQVIDEFYQYIAMGLYNLTFMLNPEKILIGGAISGRAEIFPAIKGKFQEILNAHKATIKMTVDELVCIESAHFKNDSGVIGALYHFLQMRKP